GPCSKKPLVRSSKPVSAGGGRMAGSDGSLAPGLEKNWAGPSGAALPRGMNLFGGLFLTAGGPCASPHSDVVKTAAVATLATPIERITVDFILSFYGIGDSTDTDDESVKFPCPSPSSVVTV